MKVLQIYITFFYKPKIVTSCPDGQMVVVISQHDDSFGKVNKQQLYSFIIAWLIKQQLCNFIAVWSKPFTIRQNRSSNIVSVKIYL